MCSTDPEVGSENRQSESIVGRKTELCGEGEQLPDDGRCQHWLDINSIRSDGLWSPKIQTCQRQMDASRGAGNVKMDDRHP
jgi:hypothetical protein